VHRPTMILVDANGDRRGVDLAYAYAYAYAFS
jgi:hypothetical protein